MEMRLRILLLAVTVLGIGMPAHAALLRVGTCPGASYTTIGDALAAALDGDTVFVCAGVYPEQVVVNRRIRLRGAPGAIIRPSSMVANSTSLRTAETIAAVMVVTAKATITGLDVDGSQNGIVGCSPSGPLLMGIFVRATTAAIKKNKVHGTQLADGTCDNGAAIYVQGNGTGVARVQVFRNEVYNYQRSGIVVSESGTQGLVRRNTVTGEGSTPLIAQNGVQFSFGASGVVQGNVVTNNETVSNGCVFDGGNLSFQSDRGLINNNTFTGNTGGVIVTGNQNRILHNVVDGLASGDPVGLDGIAVYGDNNSVAANTVRNQSHAGVILEGDGNQARGNRIVNTSGAALCTPTQAAPGCDVSLSVCGIGLWIAGGSRNSASGNTFASNDEDMRDDGTDTGRKPRGR
jgi:hypothetical protein